MAWKYRIPGDPSSGQVWTDNDDPYAIDGTTFPDGTSTEPNDQQITGQTPEEYARDNPWVNTATPDPTQPKQYQSWGTNPYEGWDASKIASNHDSPKYQVGRVLSNFDPRQGITPEVIAALNTLGIGTFEGSGQNLRVLNADPRFEGYTDWGDMIRGYQGGAGADATWQYGINNSRDPVGAPGGGYQDPGATDYGPFQPPASSAPSSFDLSQHDPFEAMGGGVWIPSLGQWVPKDHPLAQTPGAIPGGNRPQGGPGTPSQVVPGQDQATQDQINQAARDQIMELLRTPRTVDKNALRHSPEMQAVQLMSQRAEERDRAALAERAAAGGWSGSGGFESGVNALREGRSATEMKFMGELAVTQMERQREDIRNGIEFALNQGQFDAAQQLQRELAALEAAIEREKIAADVGMNNADLALRRELGLGDLDLRRWLGANELGFDYTQLEQQGNQFGVNALLEWLRTKGK